MKFISLLSVVIMTFVAPMALAQESDHNTTRSNKTAPVADTGSGELPDAAAQAQETEIEALDDDDDDDTPSPEAMKAKEKANKSKCSNNLDDC